MAEPIIDVDKLRTAEQDGIDENSGAANKLEPPDYVKDTGERSGDEPPVNWWNYWKNVVWQWLTHIVNDVMKGNYTFTGIKIFTSTSTSPKAITMDNGDLDVEGDTIVEGNLNVIGDLDILGYNFKLDSERIIFTEDKFIETGLVEDFKPIDGEEIVTESSLYPAYVGGNNLILVKNSDKFLYMKSVLDSDNFTAKTTYSVNAGISIQPYCGNGIIIFKKNSDNKLYKKSINNVNGESNLTSYAIGNLSAIYTGNDSLIFIKASDNRYYKKSLNTIDAESQIITISAFGACYIGNNNICYAGASNYINKKSLSDIDNSTVLSTYAVQIIIYVGNNKILFTKADNKLYIKSVDDVDNERIVMSNAVSGLTYIGNGIIIYRASDGHFYKKDIKDFC
jgi:hypothetical protein